MPKVSDVKKGTSSETDTKKSTRTVEVKETVQAVGGKSAETTPAAKAASKASAAVQETEVKAPAAAKAEAVEAVKAETKKAPAKAETKTKKTTVKKEASAKTPAEKPKAAAGSKKAKESIYIQYAGKELEISEIMEKAKDAYEGDLKSVKEFTVYVKPEENMAYFVVNGDETGSVSL